MNNAGFSCLAQRYFVNIQSTNPRSTALPQHVDENTEVKQLQTKVFIFFVSIFICVINHLFVDVTIKKITVSLSFRVTSPPTERNYYLAAGLLMRNLLIIIAMISLYA